MRGDLTIQKSTQVQGMLAGQYVSVDGDRIAVARRGVSKRNSERSFRVSMNADAINAVAPDAAVGDKIPVRLKMTLQRNSDGGRVYILKPADGDTAHGFVSVRK